MEAFQAYFNAIKSLDVNDATEHTLRGALENLLNGIAKGENDKIKVIHEPKKDKSGLGAPDFKFKLNEAILGYLENKKTSESLDQVLKSKQIGKYKQLSGNIILTNYLEWIWLKDGHIIKRETLCYASDVGYPRARLDPDKADKVGKLIASFYSTPPEKIARTRALSLALAIRCHELRDFLLEELLRQAKEHQEGRLYGLYQVFKRDVFHELELKEFADAFSQTLGYGLFLAKLNAGGNTPVTLHNAKRFIPDNFELIQELVNFLDELEKVEYQGIKWLVEEILSIMNTLNLAAIKEDLSYIKSQPRLIPQTEDERLLFAKDPYVYFYEDFLKAYDKETRKARGVYYTPPPVVNFIVRGVNNILKENFGISQGLSDRRRVTVLDFATGTGTFLVEVLQQICAEVSEGIRDQIIQQHVLKNLYGFEYLIAPYTIAHLKLSQFLHDKGYLLRSRERLQIYLTNTLEPIQPQVNWLLPALSHEVEAAQEIKEKPILVITGNPPYSGNSKNNGVWITKLIDDYKKVDGKPLGEKNTKWLQDDYVKFIRFAQWKMQDVAEGIVAIITNHSFLDNPTFRGMRQSLMQTFNQIYVLNLHGNTKKKEKTPEGGKDENVFDIEQGVAISLLVRKGELSQAVYHADLWGGRKEKYHALLHAEHTTLEWKALKPTTPFYLFIPQNEELREEYERGWKVTEIFPVNSVGIATARDNLTIHLSEQELWQTVRDFATTPVEDARRKYNLGQDVRDWKVALAQKDLQDSGLTQRRIVPIVYRPFDTRYTYYTGNSRGFHCMPRGEVMRHMMAGENIGLSTSRGKEISGGWEHVFCSQHIIQLHTVSTKEVNYLFPLYLYPSPGSLINNRHENFSREFRAFIDNQYEYHYSPEEIMGYIYALFHSPTYREQYVEFLKIDFPRIPFVDDRKTFEALAKLGGELIQAHLLKAIPTTPKIEITKGSHQVEKLVYDDKHQRLYVNKEH
jgi:predicted helicase